MNITFVWDGHPVDQTEKQNIESGIDYDLKERFTDIVFESTTVHLFNDKLKSVISGIIIGNDDKKLYRITIFPYKQNETIYETIEEQK